MKQFDEGDIVPGGLVYAGTVKPAEQIMGGWEKRATSPIMAEPELPPAIHYNQVFSIFCSHFSQLALSADLWL